MDDDDDDDEDDEHDDVRRFSIEKLGFLLITCVAVDLLLLLVESDEDVDEAQDDMLNELLSFKVKNKND